MCCAKSFIILESGNDLHLELAGPLHGCRRACDAQFPRGPNALHAGDKFKFNKVNYQFYWLGCIELLVYSELSAMVQHRSNLCHTYFASDKVCL